ncbi:MAG: UDP-N-acetylmuramate--L-alanine ligase, partial [Candidatus Krumholzibacteria bacterium]|nr:UDP-N-acetylmuramate--L-alanine ligase [Candidatus Krumholzibacteria bacterium]
AIIHLGHRGENIEGSDVVVYSSAVNESNPEIVSAADTDIPVIPRAEMLGELMRLKFAVTVAGSHGKTSTTSLLASVLAHGGLDPTVIVGGKLKTIHSNARLGSGRYLVAEADESDGSFVRLPSSIAVITNIDNEHLDYYGDLDALKRGFVEYANRVPFYGAVIMCADDVNVCSIMPDVKRRKITYSLGSGAHYPPDLRGEIVAREGPGTRFSVEYRGEPFGEITLGMPGTHYVSNALATCAVGIELEIPFYAIKKGLEDFEGVGRRFELKGSEAGVLVVDDYGHHPTEIAATVKAALDNYDRRLYVMFQPHRYSRTQAMADAFATCFDGAEAVLVTDIYPAGEKPIPGVTAQTIIDRIEATGRVDVRYAKSFENMTDEVAARVRDGDMVITMGAGDIYKAGDMLLKKLKSPAGSKRSNRKQHKR